MWKMDPDLVVIKEMRKYQRGRPEGQVAAMIEEELRACGATSDQLERADTEWQGVRRLLDLLRPGDFLFLPVHADRDLVLELMGRLERTGWAPGDPVPVRD